MIKTKISAGFCKVIFADFTPSASYSLCMAKNEAESCVISIVVDESLSGCLELTSPKTGFTVELEREHTIEIDGVKYPDPLVPMSNGELTIEAGEIANILVRFTTAADTPAGEHEFAFSLKNSAGESLVNYTVSVKVWDFALPEDRIVSTMGLTRGGISRAHGLSSLPEDGRKEREQELYVKYYDLLLENGVSAYDLPYDILDPRADEYMSSPKVGAFRVNSHCPEETLMKYYEKLSTNPTWMEKAFFYPIDEPRVPEHLLEVIHVSDKLHELCPGIKIVSPFFKNLDFNDEMDEIELLIKYLDILCPKLTCWNDEFIYAENKAHLEHFGTFRGRMDAARDSGKTMWQYVCWEPGKPYTNLYVNEDGLDHRVLFWQQHQVGAHGFLYWCVNWWECTEDPWTDMATVKDLGPDVYGDGSLVYNGNRVGIDGPCSSVRLEAVRDGLEDAEMLAMAEKLLGKEWTDAHVRSVTEDLTHYTDDAEYFLEKRRELGDAIEAEVKA